MKCCGKETAKHMLKTLCAFFSFLSLKMSIHIAQFGLQQKRRKETLYLYKTSDNVNVPSFL